jgi:hypothetical protein
VTSTTTPAPAPRATTPAVAAPVTRQRAAAPKPKPRVERPAKAVRNPPSKAGAPSLSSPPRRASDAVALGLSGVTVPVPSAQDGRALLLAGLALLALVSASGGFIGLVHRYRRELGEA